MIGKSLKADPKLAYALAERLSRRTIRKLQSLPAGLLSDDGARNLWNEICVQTRQESSFSEAYRDEVVRHLGRIVAVLPQSERVILWLNTYAGKTLGRDGDSPSLSEILAAIKDSDIVSYVLDEHLNYEMWNYSNAWIRSATGE